MMTRFSPGDLLFVSVNKKGMTLVKRLGSSELKEFYHQSPVLPPRHNRFEKSLGYNWCLVESISKNDLGQAIDYALLINGSKYKCKAILAERYLFKL